MQNEECVVMFVMSALMVGTIYLLIKGLLDKDNDMYYELTESNRELIEALNDQKEQNDIFKYNQSIERRHREQEEFKTGEDDTYFI